METFEDMSLSPSVAAGLRAAGFVRPSPIQRAAIPIARFGADMIAQAKSGTGKTCVFAVAILEAVDPRCTRPQALVVCPTREIAVQSRAVIATLGARIPGLRCGLFIGGLSEGADRKAVCTSHVAVGTPGRVLALAADSGRVVAAVAATETTPSVNEPQGNQVSGPFRTCRLIVLDEADQLLGKSFAPQVAAILSRMPRRRQTLVFSATFTDAALKLARCWMRDPQVLRLSQDEPSLEGVSQFSLCVASSDGAGAAFPPHRIFANKVRAVVRLLGSLDFHQAVLFSNDKDRAEEVAEILEDNGWPAVSIAGGQSQSTRLRAMDALRDFRVRVLVSTDLTSRGIDVERISLVVNVDLPRDPATYIHRVGRTGRFGTRGVAISIVARGAQERALERIQMACRTRIERLASPEDGAAIPTHLMIMSPGGTEACRAADLAAKRKTASGSRTDELLQQIEAGTTAREKQRRGMQRQPQTSSSTMPAPTRPEKRIDPADGNSYSFKEFIDYYGAALARDKWARASKGHHEASGTRSRRGSPRWRQVPRLQVPTRLRAQTRGVLTAELWRTALQSAAMFLRHQDTRHHHPD